MENIIPERDGEQDCPYFETPCCSPAVCNDKQWSLDWSPSEDDGREPFDDPLPN